MFWADESEELLVAVIFHLVAYIIRRSVPPSHSSSSFYYYYYSNVQSTSSPIPVRSANQQAHGSVNRVQSVDCRVVVFI